MAQDTQIQPQTDSTAPPELPAIDYASLRQEGIRQLEQLTGGRRWTDFNDHDPGITILEQLSYALSDLGYRIDYHMKDLLAPGDSMADRSQFSPAQVLSTDPVTITDLRKVLIDVDGVKNAWVEPLGAGLPEPAAFHDPTDDTIYLANAPQRRPIALEGVYRVLVEPDGTKNDSDLESAVSRRLHACRGLCQDFEPPVILNRQQIAVHAEIEIGNVDDPNRLMAEIYHALAESISPRVKFHTVDELLARGMRIDEVMDGPALAHGFLDSEEVERLPLKSGLRSSELIVAIMNVKGVVAIRKISLSLGGDPGAAVPAGPWDLFGLVLALAAFARAAGDSSRAEPWYLDLDFGRTSTPYLDVTEPLTIGLVRRRVAVATDPAKVKQFFDELQTAARPRPLPESLRDIAVPIGRDRRVERYHSILHQFPQAYGVGEFGLPASASPERHARARQLKAYLMIFDQILADEFAQLGHVKNLFSFHDDKPQTYFSQTVGVDNGDQKLRLAELRNAAKAETRQKETGTGRKNRFLDHLLARFAEEIAYDVARVTTPESWIHIKSEFLAEYATLGAGRGRAFNYTLPSWNTDNVSGLEKRIARKIGLSTYQRRDLAKLDAAAEGGFHMVEQILLRPRPADNEQWSERAAMVWHERALVASPIRTDPYSRQLSFVFPDWIKRFQDESFRKFLWQTLREETPAHLLIHWQWLNHAEMTSFEVAYKDWLASLFA
jgi:hypothetical protein